MTASSPAPATPPKDFGKGLRVLVVDDEEVIGKVLALMLKPAGFEAAVALNVASAKASFDARPADLVITDKNLPDGSGLDLIRHLTEQNADCEIMMITGFGSEESAFEAVRLGIADYLSKPFEDIATVRASVWRVVQRLAERRRLAALSREAVAPATEPKRRLRFSVELFLHFVLVDGSLSGPAFVSSLSSADLFVETDVPLPVGAQVTMRLDLPHMEVANLHGSVLRHGEGHRMTGMRIEFADSAPEAIRAVAAYLAPFRERLVGPPASATPAPASAAPASAATPAASEAEPEIADLVRRWTELYPDRDEAPAGNATPPVQLFRRMQKDQERIVGFLETAVEPTTSGPETLAPAAFDKGNAALPAAPAAPAEDSLRVELREKYRIEDSIFEETNPGQTIPVPEEPAAPRSSSNAAPQGEQRSRFARELRARGEEALARGLVLKASADLTLANVFDPEDAELAALAARVAEQAKKARAEDDFRQGLQQIALGDPETAAKLLTRAATARFDRKSVIACAKVLLMIKTPDGLRQARTIVRAALAKESNNPDFHVLLGSLAEADGLPAVALRSYKRALELDPANDAAKKAIAALEKS